MVTYVSVCVGALLGVVMSGVVILFTYSFGLTQQGSLATKVIILGLVALGVFAGWILSLYQQIKRWRGKYEILGDIKFHFLPVNEFFVFVERKLTTYAVDCQTATERVIEHQQKGRWSCETWNANEVEKHDFAGAVLEQAFKLAQTQFYEAYDAVKNESKELKFWCLGLRPRDFRAYLPKTVEVPGEEESETKKYHSPSLDIDVPLG